MRIKINREELLSQLDMISPALAARDIVEQASCVIFRDGWVIAFNDEIACQMKTDLDITGAIHAKTLIESLRKLSEDVLEVEITDNELILYGKRRKVGIAREQNILLPIETRDTPEGWKVLPESFADGIEMVLPCCGKDEQKFRLTCIHMWQDGIDASDNYQYGRYSLEMPIDEELMIRAISMKHVIPLGVTKISVTKSWVHFKNSRGLIISCRRWKEKWQDYGDILDQKGEFARFPKALADAAELAAVFSSQNADNDQVTISLKPGKLLISGEGTSGWSKEVKKVDYSGEEISFKIDPALLKRISQEHNKVEITKSALKVESNRYVYITVLGVLK